MAGFRIPNQLQPRYLNDDRTSCLPRHGSAKPIPIERNCHMKIQVGAESPPERLALTLGLVPTPVFHTLVPVLAARVLLAGTRLGVFETRGRTPLTAGDVAATLRTQCEATGWLRSAPARLG